jgi:hypothetical protein
MQGYFMVADLLGFGNLVDNLSLEELTRRVQAWGVLVRECAKTCGVARHQLFSDTVFADADDSPAGLRNLIELARKLLEEGATQSLPIRGAISHGSYEWGDLTYGDAVVEAHRLEMAQEWVGVACQMGLPHIEAFWGLDSVICYPIPKKDGAIGLHPAVAWDVPTFNILARYLTGGGLTKERDVLDWEWGRKLANTVEFGVYSRVLKRKGETGKTFRGRHPVEAIEVVLGEAGLIDWPV